jgi:hypothetical protein
VEPTYLFDDESYATLGRSGVPWQAALHILRTHPNLRQHHDGYLVVAGQAGDGQWYAIAIQEQTDDVWRVADGRPLTAQQAAAARARLHRGT